MSVVIKKGFAALRYLNVGKLITPEETIAIPAITALPKSARLVRNWALVITLLIIVHATRNAVHPSRKNPLRPEINAIPVFSNDAVSKRKTDVKIIALNIMNLLSFLRNGNARNKTPIGNMKNWIPPHDAIPNDSKIPPPAIFARETFPLSDFKPLRRR
jgi:hypothetical protein